MDYNYIENLVIEAKNGKEPAKEELFKEFKPMILNLSKRTFIDGYDFFDIKHECYTTLFKCVQMYDPNKHRFVAYASRAITNNINYLIRKSCIREIGEGKEALTLTDNLEHVLTDTSPDIDESVCDQILAKNLETYINKLAPKYREILHHTLLNDGTIKNFADINNINYSTSIGMKNRALNQLRKVILS